MFRLAFLKIPKYVYFIEDKHMLKVLILVASRVKRMKLVAETCFFFKH